MANIPKTQKALYPLVPEIDPSIPYPFKYLQNYPVSLEVLANIPVSLKTLQGLSNGSKRFHIIVANRVQQFRGVQLNLCKTATPK